MFLIHYPLLVVIAFALYLCAYKWVAQKGRSPLYVVMRVILFSPLILLGGLFTAIFTFSLLNRPRN